MNIKEEIKEYLRGFENCGALLLIGQWGSGKSHLVRTIVNDLAKKESYAIAMISLFGVDSVASLTERVRDMYLEESSVLWGKAARKTFKALQKVATTSANVTAAALPDSVTAAAIATGVSSISSFNLLNLYSVKNTVGTGDKKRKFILVFDDLERCDIPYRILLGAINEYTENRNIHTILISDEQHIPENSKMDYAIFKEKIISRTIKLFPDQESTIRSILDEYKDSLGEYRQFLLDNFSALQAAFVQSGYNNFRMLKACIFDFRRIYVVWKQANFPEDDLERLFYNFCAMTYECRSGFFKRTLLGRYSIVGKAKETEDRRYEEQTIMAKYMDETFRNVFFSVARWVVDGEWEESSFLEEVNKRYNPVGQTRDERFLTQLCWDLEQKDIDEGMPIVLEKGYAGKLDCNELLALLQKLSFLRENQIPIPCNANYLMLEEGFSRRRQALRDGDIQEPKARSNVESNEIDEEALPLYRSIERLRNQIITWQTRNMFLQFINDNKHITAYDIRDKYMDCFDDHFCESFISAYKRASNQKKREMCSLLTRMDFHNEIYSSDADKAISLANLETLHAEVSALLISSTDGITLAIAKSFISELEKKIQLLKGAEESAEMEGMPDVVESAE